MKTIEVYIDPSIKSKAARFFDCSLETILNELLQNARRSGATRIDLNHEYSETDQGTWIEVIDNGRGISDPQHILGFGAGEFTKQLQHEDPAGVGMFALAPHGAVVRSRDWSVRLMPEAFQGKEKAVVEASDPVEGTKIKFLYKHDQHRPPYCLDRTDNSFITQYYPTPLFVNGTEVPSGDDYLGFIEERILSRFDGADFKIVDYKPGIRIGMSLRRDLQKYNGFGPTTWFQGQEVRDLPMFLFNGANPSIGLWVEIHELNGLELKLPERSSYIEGPELAEFQKFVEFETTKYFFELHPDAHNLMYSTWERCCEILGKTLPEAVLDFSLVNLEVDDTNAEPPFWELDVPIGYYYNNNIIDPALSDDRMWVCNEERGGLLNLAAALHYNNNAEHEIVLVRSIGGCGYSWYKARPQIEEVRSFIIDKDGDRVPVLQTGKSYSDLRTETLDEKSLKTMEVEIEFDREVEFQGKKAKVHVLSTPFLTMYSEGDNTYRPCGYNWLADKDQYQKVDGKYPSPSLQDMILCAQYTYHYEQDEDQNDHKDSAYRESRKIEVLELENDQAKADCEALRQSMIDQVDECVSGELTKIVIEFDPNDPRSYIGNSNKFSFFLKSKDGEERVVEL